MMLYEQSGNVIRDHDTKIQVEMDILDHRRYISDDIIHEIYNFDEISMKNF